MKVRERLRRAWFGLTNPRVDDAAEREKWWREVISGLTADNDRLRRDATLSSQHSASDLAAESWREDGRFRSILKRKASLIVGSDISIDVQGDRRVARFVEEFVTHPLNCPRGSMVEGTNGFLLRIFQWYLSTLRDGDLYVILTPNAEGISIARTRPKRAIAHVSTNPEDSEQELWYAETQDPLPDEKDFENRSAWKKTWDAPSDLTFRQPELIHYSFDPLDATNHGEGLSIAVSKWTGEYERLLKARIGVNVVQSIITWLVDMPNTDYMVRMERARQMQQEGWNGAGFMVQDSAREVWEMQNPSSGGADARPDLRAVRDEAHIAAGLLPMWSGEEGSDLSLASARSISPIAASSLRAEQQEYFGFIASVVSRAVEKWESFNTYRLRDWTITVVNSDSVAYDLMERGQGFSEGVDGVEKALTAGIIDLETAQSLTRFFAGLPEDLWPEVDTDVQRFRFARPERITLSSRDGTGLENMVRARLAQATGDSVIREAQSEFQRSLSVILENATEALLADIEELSGDYDAASESGQAEIITRLGRLDVAGKDAYRAALAEWLRGVYREASPFVEGRAKPPVWVEAWITTQAQALSEKQWYDLRFAATSAALREITAGQPGARVTMSAEQAIRSSFSSGLAGWDGLARTFVEKLTEEGVWEVKDV